MANRTSYKDHSLVFAKEPADLQAPGAELGQPCPSLADRQFRQIATAADIKPIKFHGLGHSAATRWSGWGYRLRSSQSGSDTPRPA